MGGPSLIPEDHVRTTYGILAVIVLASTILHLLWGSDFPWLSDFAPGLATEVLGILFTLIFVQRILDRRQADDRARASRGGIRRAETPLRDLAELWAAIIRGSLPQAPARPPKTYRALFKSEWASWVDRTDLTQVRYAWSGESWLESAARVIRLSRHRISEILEVYSVHLDVALIEALDELRDDQYLAEVETIGEEIRVGATEPILEAPDAGAPLALMGPQRARMMTILLRCLDLYNESGLGEESINSLPPEFWERAA